MASQPALEPHSSDVSHLSAGYCTICSARREQEALSRMSQPCLFHGLPVTVKLFCLQDSPVAQTEHLSPQVLAIMKPCPHRWHSPPKLLANTQKHMCWCKASSSSSWIQAPSGQTALFCPHQFNHASAPSNSLKMLLCNPWKKSLTPKLLFCAILFLPVRC